MTTSRFQDHRSSRSHTGHSLILTSTWWHVCSWWATLVTSSLSSSLHNTGGLLPWTPPASTLALHISQSGLCLTLYDGQAFSAVSSHQLELKVWKVMCKMELFYSHKLLSISCYLNLAQRSGRMHIKAEELKSEVKVWNSRYNRPLEDIHKKPYFFMAHYGVLKPLPNNCTTS